MENLKVDFSNIFSINYKYTTQGLYNLLNKYKKRHRSESIEYLWRDLGR